MTPQILVHNLSHCFITMEMIALLIFDECHHAQVKSNHAYAVIMKVCCTFSLQTFKMKLSNFLHKISSFL